MSVTTWCGRQLEDFTYDELLSLQKKYGYYIIGRDVWYEDAMKEINRHIVLKQKSKDKVNFYIEQNGESEEINLYWFEENNIRTYEDLKQAGYRFTIDVGDNVSITI